MKRPQTNPFLCVLLALFAVAPSLSAQRIKGSDTVLPLTQEAGEAFLKIHPRASLTVTGGGSGVGLSALVEGVTDIAMASRKIKFGEQMKLKRAGQEVKEVIVAYDALAVIVNPGNPVSRLTRAQLEAIFRGKITNWKQVGGEDRKIVVYSRETSSGTYEFFKESVSHHPVRAPDAGGHRLRGPGLPEPARQGALRGLRGRGILCAHGD